MKNLLRLASCIFVLLSAVSAFSQTTFCPDDPPRNSFLADSPWPTYHRNNYAQSSTCIPGPRPGDSLIIGAKTNIRGGTSPWVYLSDRYPNGQRVLYYSNSTHVFKFVDNGTDLVTADSLRIDFDPITSFGWNFLLTNHKVWYTYDPKYDPSQGEYPRLFKLTDADTTDPLSDIIVLDTLNLQGFTPENIQGFNLNYLGQIMYNSTANDSLGYATVGVIDANFNILDTLNYPTAPGEIVHHNAFPIDEDNSMYVVTTHRLIKFAWDGTDLSREWQANYDFVLDGPTGSFAEGSGTTPTLMGFGLGNDQLIVVADGHADNNLVAFWRELPPGWTGVPGMDLRFADSIRIPLASSFSNIFQSIENSPTVRGYDVGIAQFNGFLGYDCNNIKGVQKITWDTAADSFFVAWTNGQVNMNGVLNYSAGSNLVYCSGKEADCNYYYYGVNWTTGNLDFRVLLGPEGTFTDDPYYDAGNNNLIDEDGSIYFSGGASLVKVEVAQRAVAATAPEEFHLHLYPNPARDVLRFTVEGAAVESVRLYDLQGQERGQFGPGTEAISVGALAAGMYLLRIETDRGSVTRRWVRG
ncbi:MAG: T9SS type A sorting domain-containing protein [Bacteroidota bacterium]